MNQQSRFHHPLVQYLHASLVTLIVVQFALFYLSEWFEALKPYKGLIYMLHKSTGNLTALVVLLFIAAGWHYGRPDHQLPKVQFFLASLVKVLLLASTLTMSLSGYVMTSAAGRGYRFYNLFDMPLLIAPNKELGNLAFQVHGLAATSLMILFGLHFLAALYHHFVKKDNVLRSMYTF